MAQQTRPGWLAQVPSAVVTQHYRGSTATPQNASLLPPASYDAWCLPWSIAVGDVNGDGHPDLVVAGWYLTCNGVPGTGEVSVLLSNGDGSFQPPVRYSSGGLQALGVAIGDVNGDGKLDIVAANGSFNDTGTCNGQVGVLLGNGDGTFRPAISYSSGDCDPNAVTLADLNHDGHPDIIAANSCHGLNGGGCTNPGSAGVLLGNGDGTFRPGVPYAADQQGYVASIAAQDLNGDGYIDLVMVSADSAVISILLGNGDGTFRPEISYPTNTYQPSSLGIADVNGDGHPDVIVSSYCQGISSCRNGLVSVLLGNGDGTLQSPVKYNAGGFAATSVAIADVNSDGHPDLIVATTDLNGNTGGGSGQIGVLIGNGDGTFQAAEAFPSGGQYPIAIAIADVNSDDKPDVMVVNYCGNAACSGLNQGNVGVLLNNSGITQASTATALNCTPANSGYGQTVSCTATVTSGSATPTGSVILYDGAIPAGSANLASKKAVIAVSSLATGSHSVMAVFQGSSKFAPSTSRSLTQAVVSSTTSVSLTPSANPVAVGQQVTFTATVVGQYGGGTATGTMTFQIAGKTVATVPVSNNQASYSKTYTSQGIRVLTATYSGDSNNAGSTSPALREVWGNLPYASKVIVTTSGSPTFVGQPVTFTANVSFAGNPVPDGEQVTFQDGSTQIGASSITGGIATFTTSSLAAKTHLIKAVYAGDATVKGSSSDVHQIVNKYATTATLVSSLNPSAFNQAVTFTATVTSAGPNPTGRVLFKDGTTSIGHVTLSSGVAVLTKSNLAVGTHQITAQYVGDSDSDASTSAPVSQVVN